MAILAIDFGLKRLGLAVSEGFLAKPLTVLPNNQKIFETLAEICEKLGIKLIIIGIPEGKLVKKILNFSQTLKQKLGVEVEFEDEILTTAKAKGLLIQAQSSKKKRRESLDKAAAAVILQQYLDRTR